MVVWKAFQLERSKEDRLYQQSDMLNVYLARTKHVKHQIDTDSDSKRYWVVLSVFRMWLRLMSCAHTYSNNSRVTMNSFQIHLCVRIDDSDWSITLLIQIGVVHYLFLFWRDATTLTRCSPLPRCYRVKVHQRGRCYPHHSPSALLRATYTKQKDHEEIDVKVRSFLKSWQACRKLHT